MCWDRVTSEARWRLGRQVVRGRGPGRLAHLLPQPRSGSPPARPGLDLAHVRRLSLSLSRPPERIALPDLDLARTIRP